MPPISRSPQHTYFFFCAKVGGNCSFLTHASVRMPRMDPITKPVPSPLPPDLPPPHRPLKGLNCKREDVLQRTAVPLWTQGLPASLSRRPPTVLRAVSPLLLFHLCTSFIVFCSTPQPCGRKTQSCQSSECFPLVSGSLD